MPLPLHVVNLVLQFLRVAMSAVAPPLEPTIALMRWPLTNHIFNTTAAAALISTTNRYRA